MPGIFDPSDKGAERPLKLAGGVLLGALLLRDGRWFVDHGALHGRSRAAPGTGNRVVHVWVAFRGGEFHGIAASAASDPVAQANAMATAAKGTVDIGLLEAAELATLRAYLQSCEPVRWDRASPSFKSGLKRLE